jgi:predicted N-acyltransferase
MPVERIATLEDIDEASWNRLVAGRSPFSSRSWLLFLEERAKISVGYLLWRDGDGELTAALPLYEGTTDTLPPAASPRRLFDPDHEEQGDGVGTEAVLLGGAAYGYCNDGLLIRDGIGPEERLGVAREMVTEFRSAARRAGAWTAFLLLPPEELELLSAAGYGQPAAALMNTSALLTVPGDGYEGYLRALPRRRRGEVRREGRIFERSGLEWSQGRLPEDLPEVAELVETTYRHHGYPARDPADTLDMLERQVRRFQGRNVLLVCREQGRLVGAVSGFGDGRTLVLPWLGIDYEVAKDSALYFNLGYYIPIRYAAQAGYTTIDYGVEALHAKVLRGMSLRTTWGLVEPAPDLAERWPEVVEAHNTRTYGRLQADHGDEVGALVAEQWPSRAPRADAARTAGGTGGGA